MIETVDFFTPVVDDPYTFGQIAAANSLSDVYAMGGQPKIALNVCGFPNCLDPSILGDIMAGGADKVREAGALLIGGHTIQNDEPLYGLCVAGFVHPDKVLRNYGTKPGDVLILTKEIGSGIVNTALKAEMASPESYREAVRVMTSLNDKAAKIVREYPVTACTDVTGFGLLGHCTEMAVPSDVTFELYPEAIPYIKDAKFYAEMGLIPAGAYRNRKLTANRMRADGIDEVYLDLLHDPQSSGGLLFSVPESCVDRIMDEFARADMNTRVTIIGKAVARGDEYIRLLPGKSGVMV
jgi:selenide,water dikinase